MPPVPPAKTGVKMSGGKARAPSGPRPKATLHPEAQADPTDPDRCQFTEGLARVVFPRDAPVFYNKAQVVNRDISVLAIRRFARDLPAEDARAKAQREARKKETAEREIANRMQQYAETAEEATEFVASRERAKQAAADARKAEMEANPTGALASGCRVTRASRLAGFGGKIEVFEGLSASGLRSLRYAAEIPELTKVIANDLSNAAVEMIGANVEANRAAHPGIEERVIPRAGDCNQGLLSSVWAGENFACVDLDPYGSPVPFLDAAVQGVAANGLLCVTATDMAILAGSQPAACFSKYGSMPTRGKPWIHEQALRILLATIARFAARHRRGIEPVLSLHIDFYARVFVRVREGADDAAAQARKVGMVHTCAGCVVTRCVPFARRDGDGNQAADGKYRPSHAPGTGDAEGRCKECGFPMHVVGPMWLDPIQDPEFIGGMLDILDETEGRQGSSADGEEKGEEKDEGGAAKTDGDGDGDGDGGDADADGAKGKGKGKGKKKKAKRSKDGPDAGSPGGHFAASRRIRGLLGLAKQELPDAPFCYDPSYLAHLVHTEAMTLLDFQSALVNLGYRVSDAHMKAGAVKTDAPPEAVLDILRTHARDRVKPSLKGPGKALMERAPTRQVSFEPSPKVAQMLAQKRSASSRFCDNPEGYQGGPLSLAARKKRKQFAMPGESNDDDGDGDGDGDGDNDGGGGGDAKNKKDATAAGENKGPAKEEAEGQSSAAKRAKLANNDGDSSPENFYV